MLSKMLSKNNEWSGYGELTQKSEKSDMSGGVLEYDRMRLGILT